jgi:hypothetical protein
MKYKVTKCKSCGADVIWTVTENNMRMQVDAEPNLKGRFMLREPVSGGAPLSVHVNLFSDTDGDDGLRYVPHFATCPDADKWRRSRK